MKVRIDKIEKIRKAVLKAERSCNTRLFDMNRIYQAIKDVERKLMEMGIAKQNRTGCKIYFNPEQVPNRYITEDTAYGTYATIERSSTHWFLTEVYRDKCEFDGFGEPSPAMEYLLLSNIAKLSIPSMWEIKRDNKGEYK